MKVIIKSEIMRALERLAQAGERSAAEVLGEFLADHARQLAESMEIDGIEDLTGDEDPIFEVVEA